MKNTFVKFTTPEGETIYIRPEHILGIRSTSLSDRTYILLTNGDNIVVTTAIKDVLHILQDC